MLLSDFGIAIVEHTLNSLSSQNQAGTPLYMAPEQIQRHPCPASDQYALGVIVYEWLCGKLPFPGPGAAVFSQHLHQQPLSLCTRMPELPIAVKDAVFGTLAKDPTQRFITVQDFAGALEEACFATQPLTLQGPPKTRTQDPTVSQHTLLIPPSTAREPEGTSSLTQPVPMTMPQTKPGEEVRPNTVQLRRMGRHESLSSRAMMW